MAAPVKPMTFEFPARPRTETDWAAFVDTSGRVVLRWLRQSDLPAEQGPSLVREILTAIHREFCAVASEPSLKFRSWLQYAANASWCLVLENLAPPEGEAQASATAMLLLSLEAHDRFLRALDEECSRQRRCIALARIQPVGEPGDWQAFAMTVFEQQPLADVAARFQCQESAIRAALYRVRMRLQEEYLRLEETI